MLTALVIVVLWLAALLCVQAFFDRGGKGEDG